MSIIQLDFTPERVEKKWYLNPYKFIDDIDLMSGRGAAYVFLLDLLVNRPTEFKALMRMLARAFVNIDLSKLELTQRQRQAVETRLEAIRLGRTDIQQYVAGVLGISQPAVSQLLSNADKRTVAKTLYSGELLHVYDSDSEIHWTPTEPEIKAQMAKMTRQCAADGTPGCEHTTRGRFALCWPCSQKYGSIREEWLESRNGQPAPTWLLAEARRIDQQLRQDATNALYGQRQASEYERQSRKVRRAA